jgi:RluA family pseudouridine synthase
MDAGGHACYCLRVAKPNSIELADGMNIPILYEDRSVIAIDKPVGWMLVPYNWDKSDRNLHLAISSSILAGDFWARSRGLKYLRHVHRLDAETSGVLLLAKSPGALQTYSRLFESRQVEKKYIAVVQGIPSQTGWTCWLKIAPDPIQRARMKIDSRHGKDAETQFTVLQVSNERALLEARPLTGRTHQIRLHLAAAGHPVVGDNLYGPSSRAAGTRHGSRTTHHGSRTTDHGSRITHHDYLGLRAVALAYRDPFTRKNVRISAPTDEFCREYGFVLHQAKPLT